MGISERQKREFRDAIDPAKSHTSRVSPRAFSILPLVLTHSTSRRAIDVLGDFSESVVSGNPGKSRGFPDADESKKGKNVVTAEDEGRNVKGGRDKAEGMVKR